MRPPRALPTHRSPAWLTTRLTALSCAALCAGTLSVVAAGSAQSAPRAPRAAAAMTLFWRGNGHGHGMSQYGAEGAALQGRSAKQILAFYYPGTTLTTIKASTIRVRLSNTTTADTTVLAGTTGLKLSGYGALPAAGYSQFRLVPSGVGLQLQARKGAAWKKLRAGLPSRADFSSAKGWVQVLDSDGSSTRYRGTVGAVRAGSSEWTINRVAMDAYVQASVPREVPASWKPAAVQAQAIAARSYAEATRAYSGGAGSQYDICDTTSCQSYGGMAHYDSAGHLLWTDDPAALTGNANVVMHYKGAPVFAQYSASNGGATVDGGRPYLIGKSDPYDTAASGDPYLDESKTITMAALASSYGLRSASSVQVTKRDGNGPWGGRILAAYVNGTTRAGGAAHLATTGFDLGDAMGVGTDYLRFDSPAPVSTAAQGVDAVQPARLFDTRTARTTIDAAHPYRFAMAGHGSIPKSGATSVQLTVTVLEASATGVLRVVSSGVAAESLAALAYRTGRMTTATISVPLTPSGTVVFAPSAGHVQLVADQESYTSSAGSRITTASKHRVAIVHGVATGAGTVLNLTGLPGVTSKTTGVVLAVDAKSPVRTWLRLWPDGTRAPVVAHLAVLPDAAANTLIVPLGATHRLRIGAGAHGIVARVVLLGTLGPSGGRFVTFPPTAVADDGASPAGRTVGRASVTMALTGVNRVPASTVDSVLLEVTVRSAKTAGSLWLRPSESPPLPQPAVRFAGGASTTATTLVRLGRSGRITLQSSVAAVHVSIDAIGYITST